MSTAVSSSARVQGLVCQDINVLHNTDAVAQCFSSLHKTAQHTKTNTIPRPETVTGWDRGYAGEERRYLQERQRERERRAWGKWVSLVLQHLDWALSVCMLMMTMMLLEAETHCGEKNLTVGEKKQCCCSLLVWKKFWNAQYSCNCIFSCINVSLDSRILEHLCCTGPQDSIEYALLTLMVQVLCIQSEFGKPSNYMELPGNCLRLTSSLPLDNWRQWSQTIRVCKWVSSSFDFVFIWTSLLMKEISMMLEAGWQTAHRGRERNRGSRQAGEGKERRKLFGLEVKRNISACVNKEMLSREKSRRWETGEVNRIDRSVSIGNSCIFLLAVVWGLNRVFCAVSASREGI